MLGAVKKSHHWALLGPGGSKSPKVRNWHISAKKSLFFWKIIQDINLNVKKFKESKFDPILVQLVQKRAKIGKK